MSLTILILESYEAFGDVLGELLESWGYHAYVTRNVDEAERQLQADSSIQVALVEDDMRKGIDGVAAVRRLKSIRSDAYFFLNAVIMEDPPERGIAMAGVEGIWSKGETAKMKENFKVLDEHLNPDSSF